MDSWMKTGSRLFLVHPTELIISSDFTVDSTDNPCCKVSCLLRLYNPIIQHPHNKSEENLNQLIVQKLTHCEICLQSLLFSVLLESKTSFIPNLLPPNYQSPILLVAISKWKLIHTDYYLG